jgi:phage shock protein E
MEITADKLKRMQMLHVAFILIDLRSAEMFGEGHITGAFNIPHDQFLKELPNTVPKKDTPLVVYDEDGKGAIDLVIAAENLGYINIVNLEGGYSSNASCALKKSFGET